MLNLSLKTVVIYCDGLLFFLSLFDFKRLCLRNFDISRHISVLIGITCFSEHISVNKRLWLMQATSKKMDEKNWKKYGGIKKAPMTNKENAMKTWNSLLLKMDFLHVCQWNKCTCLQIFFDNVRKICTKWLQLNILFSESVFTSNMKGAPSSLYVFECAVRGCLSIFDSFKSGMLFTFSFLVLIYMCIRLHLFPHLVDLTRGSFLLEMQIPAMAGWSTNSERCWK